MTQKANIYLQVESGKGLESMPFAYSCRDFREISSTLMVDLLVTHLSGSSAKSNNPLWVQNITLVRFWSDVQTAMSSYDWF